MYIYFFTWLCEQGRQQSHGKGNDVCFTCGYRGHWSYECGGGYLWVDTVPDKLVPARMVLTSSQDQRMGPNLVQVQHTVGSEHSDLSDDEFSE